MNLAYIKHTNCIEDLGDFRDKVIEFGYDLEYYPSLSVALSDGINREGADAEAVVIEAGALDQSENRHAYKESVDSLLLPVIIVESHTIDYSESVREILDDSESIIVESAVGRRAFSSILRTLIRLRKMSNKLLDKSIEKSQSDGILQRIIDTLPDLIWMKDLDGVYMTCNKRFEQFFNADKSVIAGRTDYNFVDRELADAFRMHDALALEKGLAHSKEETLLFGDGHIETVETIRTPIYDGENKPYAVLGIARDITMRRKSEKSIQMIGTYLEHMVEERTETLKVTMERLSLATRSAQIGTWDWDIINDKIWWDPILYDIFGMEHTNEIRDENFIDEWQSMIHPEDYSLVMDEILNAGDFKSEGEVNFRILRSGGEVRHLNVLFKVFRDKGDRAYRFVGMCSDVTAEMEYKKYLQEAKDMAEQANDAKTRFLANMSHEIRTPINAIIGMNYLLGKTELDDVQRDFIRKIQISSEQLLGIVTGILDFSKIEAGKVKLEKRPFDMKRTVRNIYEIHRNDAVRKGLEFHLHYDVPLEEKCLGDSLRLEQVLNNLVNNAIKFTKEGIVSMSVKMLNCRENEVQVAFSVRDTGIGLTERQKNRIFQAFHQADVSTTRNYGGTGLGLVICQELVRLMGGDIRVYSKANQGSLFGFQLSFSIETTEEEQELCCQYIPKLREGISILVVEDNELNQVLTQQILSERGAEVHVAENGKQAVDLIESGLAVDVILMDLQMPVMDGREATKRIRQLEGSGMIPIIALTADVTKGIKDELIEDGLDDYISKPVHVQKMIQTIKLWE